MIKHLTVIALVLIGVLVALTMRDQMGIPAKTLMVFYSGNLRGQIKPFVGDVLDYQRMNAGGFAFIRGLIDQSLARYRLSSESALILDTGDSLFGSAEASLTMGKAPYDMMCQIPYDAMAVGNMEFEFGLETLRAFANEGRLPMLACNYRDLKSPLGNTFLPGKIVEKMGSKIGLIGLGHTDLSRLTRQENVLQVEITDMRSAVAKTATALRTQGAELIVLLSHHPGLDQIENLGQAFPDVDVVIGDVISRSSLNPDGEPAPQTRPLVCPSAPARGSGLGVIRIPYISGRWDTTKAITHTFVVDADQIKPNPAIAAEVNRVEAKVDALLEEVIGFAGGDFKRSFNDESMIGKLITDSMRIQAKTEVALLNSGAIKSAFASGPISLRDLYDLLPFENSLVKISLAGWQLENLIEESLAEHGTFLQASGIQCTFSSKNPPGFRVIQLAVDEQPIDWNAYYTVAVTDFMLDTHQSWPDLGHATSPAVVGQLRESLKNYISSVGSLTPQLERRFQDVRDQDDTLSRQALEIELASLSTPLAHTPAVDSPFACLVADAMRREAETEFAFIQHGLIRHGEDPIGIVTPARVNALLPEPTGVVVTEIQGVTIKKMIETSLANPTGQISFAGLSIELLEGNKLGRIFPWIGDFDPNRAYKVALTQNFPMTVEGAYDLRPSASKPVFADIRRVLINGLRRNNGKVETRRAIY